MNKQQKSRQTSKVGSKMRQNLKDLAKNRPVAPFSCYVDEMMRSSEPLPSLHTDEIEVNGERGIYMNKAEATAWSVLPDMNLSLSEYKINQVIFSFYLQRNLFPTFDNLVLV